MSTSAFTSTIPIFAAKTSAEVALAKNQLAEAQLDLGNKRQQVRLGLQQKARSVRELDSTHEVARLDLQLAQETVQVEQAKFDQQQDHAPRNRAGSAG